MDRQPTMSWGEIEGDLKNLLQADRIDDAIYMLEDALSKIEDVEQVALVLAHLHRIKKNFSRSLEILKYLQGVNRSRVEPHLAAARVQLDIGNMDEAVDELRTVLFLDSNNPEANALFDKFDPKIDAWPDKRPDIIFYTGTLSTPLLPKPSEYNEHSLGGSEAVLFTMAMAIKKLGFNVAIFGRYKGAFVDGGIQCIDLRRIFTMQKREELPICIVQRFYDPILQKVNCKRRIFWLHDIVHESYRSVFEELDRGVDEYFLLSRYQLQNYRDRVGLNPERCYLTDNGVELELFGELMPLEGRKKNQIIYTSRPTRGLGIALKVFKALREKRPELEFIVATYSTYPKLSDDPEIAQFLSDLNTPGVRFVSYGKFELIAALKESMVQLYPNSSDLETSCLAVIEAMAAGTPVITTDRGCLRETVADGRVGEIVSWTDDEDLLVEQLSDRVWGLLEDRERWERYSQNAYHYSRERFESGQLAASWLKRLGLI